MLALIGLAPTAVGDPQRTTEAEQPEQTAQTESTQQTEGTPRCHPVPFARH